MNKSIYFSLIIIFVAMGSFFSQCVTLQADCSLPNVDSCIYNYEYKDVHSSFSVLNVSNSNILINNLYIDADSTFNLNSSSITLNAINVSSSDYSLNINIDDSTLKLNQQSNLIINELNFTKTTTTDSGLWIAGSNTSNITINNITTCFDCTSNILVDNNAARVVIFNGNLTNLYIHSGVVTASSNTEIPSEIHIDNIYGTNPYCNDDDTSCNNESATGTFIVNGANVYVHNLSVDQLFIQSGILEIDESMNVNILGGYNGNAADGFLILNGVSGATVDELRIANINLISSDLTISGGGEIYNLTADDASTVNYNKTSSSDYYHKENLIIRDSIDVVNFNIGVTDADTVNSTVEIYGSGNINNINYNTTTEDFTNTGTLYLHRGVTLTSDYVYLDTLIMTESTYYISNTLSVNNLYLDNGTLILAPQDVQAQDLTLETLYFINNSTIEGINDLTIATNNPEVQATLVVDNALLMVNNFNATAANITIYVDDNEYIKDPTTGIYEGNLTSGISADGEIHLDCNADYTQCTNVTIGLQDTSGFALDIDHTYIVMHADGGITIEHSTTTPDTNLPEWFSVCVSSVEGECVASVDEINGNDDLYVTVSRDATYTDLVRASDSTNPWTLAIAQSLDAIIAGGVYYADGTYNEYLAKLITQIDLLSDVNNIASNISSLAPIDPNVFIGNIHNVSHSLLTLLNHDDNSSMVTQKQGLLWIRNGYAKGTNTFEYTDSNNYNYFLVQAGVDFFSWQNDYSAFNVAISTGVNLGQTDSYNNIYKLTSTGYDAALTLNYNLYSYYINLTSAVVKINNANTRMDFANNIMLSNANSQEVFNSISVGKSMGLQDFTLQNSLFVNSGLITLNGYQEDGVGALQVNGVNSAIFEYGTRFTLLPQDTFLQNLHNNFMNNLQPNFSTELYYKNYNTPNVTAGFVGMDSIYDMYLVGANANSMVFNYTLGVNYVGKDYLVNFQVGREVGISNYSKNYFLINYRLSL